MTDSRPVYSICGTVQPIADKFSDGIPSGVIQKGIDAPYTGIDRLSDRFSDVGTKIWYFNETADKGTNGLADFP